MGRRKSLTVGELRKVLDGAPGGLPTSNLPIVIAGGKQKVVGAEIVYQASFSSFDYCGLNGDDKPTAVVLRVVAV